VIEKVGPPFTPVGDLNVSLTTEWKQYQVSGTSPAYPPWGLGVRFQMGHQEGELDIAGVRLDDEGPDPVQAKAKEAVEPQAVEARIRKHRMGTLTVRVRDRAAKPVKGVEVSVRQTRHAFLFGCNIFGLSPDDQSERQRRYQGQFTALHNYATLPFYWGSFEPAQGAPQYSRLDAMARWCRDQGLATKGHPLVWHEVYPRWAPSDPDKAATLLEARIREIIPHYKGLVTYWDVLNEANNAAMYPATGTGAWIKRDGPVDVVATTLRWAREASQGLSNCLLYNDFNTTEANVRLLEGLRHKKALPDAIGIQSHMHGGVWPIEQVWSTVERFAVFGLPIHFTELTVVSGPRSSDQGSAWLTAPEGERAQADYVERIYSLLFSHPAVEAITWWDFSDYQAWQAAPAGLVRKDMSPKPAYERLMALVKGRWWTQAGGRTDTRGSYSTRAFQGAYKVTVTDSNGRTTTRDVVLPLGKRAASVDLVLD
jgi:GH35 family endo-1,4-beta-xylanase